MMHVSFSLKASTTAEADTEKRKDQKVLYLIWGRAHEHDDAYCAGVTNFCQQKKEE